jgi:hypothetical protein
MEKTIDKWLRFEIRYKRASRSIAIMLHEHTQEEGQKWPVKEMVGIKIMSIKWCLVFGISIPKRIAKLQKQLLDNYKSQIDTDIELRRLFDEFEAGKYVIEDGKTAKFLSNIKKIPDVQEKN